MIVNTGEIGVEEALAVVGIDLPTLLDAAGSVLDGGRPYLVGSLAVGLGNRGSDVDIHHFQPGVREPGPPYLMFVEGVTVDVEFYPGDVAARSVDRFVATPVAQTGIGGVALAPAPGRAIEDRLTRWLTALPLRADDSPLVVDDARPAVLAVLVRAAYEQLLQLAALAALADRAGGRGAAYLWRRCGRQALEVACRAGGDVATGDKWLPRRANRTVGDETLVAAAYTTGDEPAFRRVYHRLRLPFADPLSLTAVAPDEGARELTIGRRRLLVTRHGRVFPEWTAVAAPTEAATRDVEAGQLLHAIRTGQLTLSVDPRACEELLCRQPTTATI